MAHYLKCAQPWASYLDPSTRTVIRRGQVICVVTLTNHMKKRLLAKGLIEVSEEEWKASQKSEKKEVQKASSEKKTEEAKKHQERIKKGEKSKTVQEANVEKSEQAKDGSE